jgi:hypothetical protein
VYIGATGLLLELFVSRKKKNRASYWEPFPWLDGLSPFLRQPTPSMYVCLLLLYK